MTKNIVIVFLLFLLINIQLKSQENNKMTDLTQLISEVQTQYAPDKRVALFQISVRAENGNFILEGLTNLPQAKEALLTQLSKLKINYTDAIELLPAKKLGEKIFGVVNLSVANIRTKPDHPEELATQSLLGTVVNVLQDEHGWYRVQTPDEYISWVDDDGVQLMTKAEADAWKSAPKIIYISTYGFSYLKADEKSEPVSDLVKGDILKFVDEINGYYQVEYPDKRTAFIPVKHGMKYNEWLESFEQNSDKIIETARTFMGIPYLWGGTSMKGVDCSGFTKTVYYLNGVILPRDASQQVNVGELIDTKDGFDNLKPGDLVFFGRKASADRKERATHVGMYIGKGEYIHSSGRVRINSFDKNAANFNQYRFNSFLKARRILSSLDKDGVYLLKNHKSYAEVAK